MNAQFRASFLNYLGCVGRVWGVCGVVCVGARVVTMGCVGRGTNAKVCSMYMSKNLEERKRNKERKL